MTAAVDCLNHNISIETLIKLLIRDADCEPYVTCDTPEGWEALAKQLFSVLEDGTLALNVCECEEPLG